MNASNINYELNILKAAINNYLDRTLPSDANQALYLIQYQIDDFVWNIATSIHSQSGYKVDFSLVRDLANDRIESLRMLAARQAEEARQKPLEEKKRKIEEARRIAEAEAKRKAEEEARKIEQARIEAEAKKRTPAEIKREEEARYKIWGNILDDIHERQITLFEEVIKKATETYKPQYSLDRNIFNNFLKSREEIFRKIINIIAEFLDEPEDNVNLKTSFPDPRFGSLYIIEQIEYEFNVKFPSNYIHYTGYLTSVRIYFYIVCCLKEQRVIR
ncbi:MAG: hypothetical protein ACRC2S_00010 [Waterburya sp.]